MTFQGEQLTDEEISECKTAFGLYDRDGDGYVTTTDLGSALRSMGIFPTDNELMDILNETDPEGNGEIEFGQFLDIVFKKTRDYKHEEELRLAFSTYDLDGNGKISMADFEYIIESLKLTDQEITDMKKEADRRGFGYVAYDDFVTMLAFR